MNLIAFFQSLTLCLLFILFEALISTKRGRVWFDELKQPKKAPSINTWYWLGGMFYIMCGIVGYRLFSSIHKHYFVISFLLLCVMMFMNALSVTFLFRRRSLSLSYISNFPLCISIVALGFRSLEYDIISSIPLFFCMIWSGLNLYYLFSLRKINTKQKIKFEVRKSRHFRSSKSLEDHDV